MSIDMQNYTGEEQAVAAEQHKELNSYQAETQSEDYGVPASPQKEEPAAEVKAAAQPEASPFSETPQDRNFRALADQVEKLKAEREQDRREHQLQLDMLKANSAPRVEQPKPKNMFEGMADTDIPNVSEIRREWESRESNYQARIQELQVAQFHPDYAEVVEKFGAPLLKEKPILLNSVLGAENKALALYEIGKLAQQAKMAATPAPAPVAVAAAPAAPSPAAQKIVENARKPGSLASVGGQSALSQADYYATMSDADFMKMANKHLAEI